MKKFFRYHRGLFDDSIATRIEVDDFADMCRKIKTEFPYVHNIRISKTHYCDGRLPEEWGTDEWLVMADVEENSSVVIGWSNFYE